MKRAVKDTSHSRTRLKRDLVRHCAVPLTERDLMLLVLGTKLILERHDPKKRRLVACGWGSKQLDPYWAFQLNCARAREASICAEGGIMVKAQDNDDEVETVVTIHAPDQRSAEPYVVPPCPLCVIRLDRFAEKAWVIVRFEGDLVKIPQDTLMSFPYPKD